MVFWVTPGSSGEAEDVRRTAEDVRKTIASEPGARVRLFVGTRAFGERVLAELGKDEGALVTLVVVSEDGASCR